jgi:hypothetical protein
MDAGIGPEARVADVYEQYRPLLFSAAFGTRPA